MWESVAHLKNLHILTIKNLQMKSELIFEIVGPEFRRKSFGKFIKEIAGLDWNFEKMLKRFEGDDSVMN